MASLQKQLAKWDQGVKTENSTGELDMHQELRTLCLGVCFEYKASTQFSSPFVRATAGSTNLPQWNFLGSSYAVWL